MENSADLTNPMAKLRVSIGHNQTCYGPAKGTLCANISDTILVLLINKQGKKEKGSNEREFSWGSAFRGFGWRDQKSIRLRRDI